jgi:predicted nucleic acid-binding protein
LIVLDASVLIAHFETADDHHDRAKVLLDELAERSFAISVLTLAEVLVMPTRSNQLDVPNAALRRLGLTPIALDIQDVEHLARLRASTDLKLPDCCVILAAEKANGDVATFDGRLAEAASERGLVVHGR